MIRYSLALPLMMVMTAAAAATPQETTLYSFMLGQAAEHPFGGLVADEAGNLFGTTQGNPFPSVGPVTYGTVFELAPPNKTGGSWTFKILYAFQGSNDGAYPAAGVVRDEKGTLFGTTGLGNVFELQPPVHAGKPWHFSSLANPQANASTPLTRDGEGNLYGTSLTNGIGYGSVFEVSPPAKAGAGWTTTTLYNFKGGSDGSSPYGQLLYVPESKTLYGTTRDGGTTGCFGNTECGTAFQLVYQNGSWQETVLHVFDGGVGGATPYAGLIRDKAGNLYGANITGGDSQGGTVFELVNPGNGETPWAETVLAALGGNYGSSPMANVALDGGGSLVGTTQNGGLGNGGTAFRISPPKPGMTNWTVATLYNFSYSNGFPTAPLLPGRNGTLFGTVSGSFTGPGLVFEIQR